MKEERERERGLKNRVHMKKKKRGIKREKIEKTE